MRQLRIVPIAVLALSLALVSGCRGIGYRPPVTVVHPRVQHPSGLEYEVVLTGIGREATLGSTLTIDYTAWLEDGAQLDSTRDRGLPFTFVLGEAPFAGWDVGLAGMREGGQRRLYVPPALAYGDEGVPGLVPPDATLVFLVELLEVLEPKQPDELDEECCDIAGDEDEIEDNGRRDDDDAPGGAVP